MKQLLASIGLILALGLPAFAQTETIDIWAAGDSTPDAVTLSAMGTDSAGNREFGFDYTSARPVRARDIHRQRPDRDHQPDHARL